MKWKTSKENPKDVQKKQSVSSTTSMSILRDENLTFHRFATDVSIGSRRTSDERDFNNGHNNHHNHSHHLTVTDKLSNEQSNFPSTIWTTSASHKSNNNYTTDTNDFQYVPSSEISKNNVTQSNSLSKLMPIDEETNKQSKCSICRGIILCLCLNMTYANIVRFPRELEQHGSAFLIPYFTILLLIGLPTILLEISLGQFLGQGAAHAWRASPILKGASIIGRVASWLCTIWTAMQSAIAIVYIGELMFKSVPFSNCASKVRLDATNGYVIVANSGQECMNHTFLTPVWEHTLYFALLTMSLIVLWILAMICTYSGKTLRRSILLIGITTILLISLITGWKFYQFSTISTPLGVRAFDAVSLGDSTIWFNALVQVIFSTTIGTGVWPVITGKFLYKGDAVRTTLVYLSFNIIITALAASFFMTHYSNPVTTNSTVIYPELMPFTVIYDSALEERNPLMARLVPGLSYLVIVLASILTIALCIYTSSRIIRRHPNYILSFTGLMVSIASLLCPKYLVARLLDTRITGTFIVCALIFDIIAITWIYGAKAIYTDLEFSIGRPVMKLWVLLWCITPIWLAGLLIWWAITYTPTEIVIQYVPRWGPIICCLGFIVILACAEVYKQVDYNCCSMIQEAAQPSKDWGPADPIVRHAWKQWTSVCEDTGQKDFTLRRRGTRDYTHSIKRGQYSRANNPDSHFRKSSTPGNSSPNCSGSVFDDSAIEEDAVSGYNSQFNAHSSHHPLRHSNSSRKTSATGSPRSVLQDKQRQMYSARPIKHTAGGVPDYSNNISKIEIVSTTVDANGGGSPSADYRRSLVRNNNTTNRNPVARATSHQSYVSHPNSCYGSFKDSIHKEASSSPDNNFQWKRYTINAEEYSTEL